MTDKKQLKVIRGTHYDQDTDTFYKAGEVAELPAELLNLFPWSFEDVNVSEGMVAEDNADENEPDTNEFDADGFVSRTPWSTVVKDIKSGAYDEFLEGILEAEESDRDRDKVKEVISARLGQT